MREPTALRTPHVALRKESVDRNKNSKKRHNKSPRSLSARRAWIEIKIAKKGITKAPVALRKESVDRNPLALDGGLNQQRSLSARRAWIEIC